MPCNHDLEREVPARQSFFRLCILCLILRLKKKPAFSYHKQPVRHEPAS